MLRQLACAATLLSLAVYVPPASAAPYTDDLSKCLVGATSDSDKAVLIDWMFSVISLNPRFGSLVTITPPQRQAYDVGLANLVQRLLLRDCHNEAVAALKYEGSDTLSSSLKVFGEVAMKEMMNNSTVKSGLSNFSKDIDTSKMNTLFSEAGIGTAK